MAGDAPVSQNSQPTAGAGVWRCFPASLAFAVLLFGTLFLLDFPKPGLDDLFFVGTSLNLAQGGDYSNPLLERQQFPSHFYFAHPPTYSYAMAGWLKIFGASASSMLGFQLLMYLLICAATIVLLRRNKAGVLLQWLVPLAVAAAFLPEGLRPEAFSVALTMCGLALVLGGPARALPIFTGFLLIVFGATAAERLVLFSAALVLAAMVELRKKGIPILRSGLLAGAALLLVCALLSWLIGFRFEEFWRTFYAIAAGRTRHGLVASLAGFFITISIVQWPIVLAWLVALPFAAHWRDTQFGRANLFLIGAFVATTLAGAIGHGAIWYVLLMLLFISASGVRPVARAPVLMPFAIAAVLLIANSRHFLYAAGMVSGKIKADQGDRLAEARALRSSPEHAVLIDSETARYVFDYRIPQHFLDWSFSSRFPGTLATDDPLRPGDIYLVGPMSVDWLNLKTRLDMRLPRWKPLGPGKTFHEFPRRVYLIHPEQCGGPR